MVDAFALCVPGLVAWVQDSGLPGYDVLLLALHWVW